MVRSLEVEEGSSCRDSLDRPVQRSGNMHAMLLSERVLLRCNKDATEVMYGFHSDKGMEMLKRLPKAKTGM